MMEPLPGKFLKGWKYGDRQRAVGGQSAACPRSHSFGFLEAAVGWVKADWP